MRMANKFWNFLGVSPETTTPDPAVPVTATVPAEDRRRAGELRAQMRAEAVAVLVRESKPVPDKVGPSGRAGYPGARKCLVDAGVPLTDPVFTLLRELRDQELVLLTPPPPPAPETPLAPHPPEEGAPAPKAKKSLWKKVKWALLIVAILVTVVGILGGMRILPVLACYAVVVASLVIGFLSLRKLGDKIDVTTRLTSAILIVCVGLASWQMLDHADGVANNLQLNLPHNWVSMLLGAILSVLGTFLAIKIAKARLSKSARWLIVGWVIILSVLFTFGGALRIRDDLVRPFITPLDTIHG